MGEMTAVFITFLLSVTFLAMVAADLATDKLEGGHWFLPILKWLFYISFVCSMGYTFTQDHVKEPFAVDFVHAFGSCVLIIVFGVITALGGGAKSSSSSGSSSNSNSGSKKVEYAAMKLGANGWLGTGSSFSNPASAQASVDYMQKRDPKGTYRVMMKVDGKITGGF